MMMMMMIIIINFKPFKTVKEVKLRNRILPSWPGFTCVTKENKIKLWYSPLKVSFSEIRSCVIW
jgi:hypothetical protein